VNIAGEHEAAESLSEESFSVEILELELESETPSKTHLEGRCQ
jgi:hypothetical protein